MTSEICGKEATKAENAEEYTDEYKVDLSLGKS